MLRCLSRNLSLFKNMTSYECTALSVNRSLFTESAIGIDKFKQFRERQLLYKDKCVENVEKFKKALEENKLDVQTASNMMFTLQTDEELDLFLRGLKQCDLAPINMPGLKPFRYSAPIMRLLFVLNKTDLALELMLDEKTRAFLKPTACTVLGTKLFNEGRYSDVIRLIDYTLDNKNYLISENGLKEKGKLTEFPEDLILLAFASLNKIGDLNSFNKLKEYEQRLRAIDAFLPFSAIAHGVFLGLKHNDGDFANKLFGLSRKLDLTSAVNLKLLVLSHTNINEAVDLLALKQSTQTDAKKIFFKNTVLNKMRKFIVKANNPELLSRFDGIVDNLASSLCYKEFDFERKFFLPRSITFATLSKMRQKTFQNRQNESNNQNSRNDRRFDNQSQQQGQRYGSNQKFNGGSQNFDDEQQFEDESQQSNRQNQYSVRDNTSFDARPQPKFRAPTLIAPRLKKFKE